MLTFNLSLITKFQSSASARSGFLGIVIITMAVAATATGQQASVKLAKIEIEGLQRLSRDQVYKISGLEIGQTVDVAGIDAAAQRLMDSGLIRKLAYRTHTSAGQTTLTFQIEEARVGDSPVVFDNFVWFTDEELAKAVIREVPYFNGTAPDAGNLTDGIVRGLQLFLSEHKIAGKVEYMPAGDTSGKIVAHVFGVRGIRMPVCTLHFPGARNMDETRLINSSKDIMGTDYSRIFASAFAVSSLLPIYREVGQLRATFAAPAAKPEATANCSDGVDLSLPVDEGAIYSWAKAEWSGNQVLTPQELDASLGMKSGEVANGLKFDKGLIAVRRAYGRKGHIAASLQAQPDFDEASSKVSYRIDIREGPQYHMGDLIVKGYSDNLAAVVRTLWELRPGEVWNQDYADEFFKVAFGDIRKRVLEERQAPGKPAPKFGNREQPNGKSLTVDVTIEITN
jgi:outer membrane protein assembly factor BamA